MVKNIKLNLKILNLIILSFLFLFLADSTDLLWLLISAWSLCFILIIIFVYFRYMRKKDRYKDFFSRLSISRLVFINLSALIIFSVVILLFKNQILVNATINDNSVLAKSMIVIHADPNFRDRYNGFPLFYAVSKNNINLVKYLLEYNANINMQNDGWNSIAAACDLGHINAANILAYEGAILDVTLTDSIKENCGHLKE